MNRPWVANRPQGEEMRAIMKLVCRGKEPPHDVREQHRAAAKIHAMRRAKYRCGVIVDGNKYTALCRRVRRGEARLLADPGNNILLFDIGVPGLLAVWNTTIRSIVSFLPDISWWREASSWEDYLEGGE